VQQLLHFTMIAFTLIDLQVGPTRNVHLSLPPTPSPPPFPPAPWICGDCGVIVAVSNHEACPLRPLVLIYGKHEQIAQLRAKHDLVSKDVFILGLSGSSTFEAHCPYATQFFFGESVCYNDDARGPCRRQCPAQWRGAAREAYRLEPDALSKVI
jgi:hypothetical protein